jgi:signal transduction histidine kinase
MSSIAAPVPAIEFRRRQRANEFALLCSRAALPVVLLAAWLDLCWGSSYVFLADLLMCSGFFVSLYLSKFKERDSFYWEPAYLTLWINSVVLIYFTGGAASPFLMGYLSLLFVVGAVAQTRFSVYSMLLFFLFNFVGWSLYSHFWASYPVPGHGLEFYVFGKKLTLLGGFAAFMISFIATEQKLSELAHKQSEKLKETEGQLFHATRMAEIGDLLAMTVHDLSQPVQVLNSTVPVLKSLLGKNAIELSPYAPLFEKMEFSCKHAISLIVRLRDFSRNDPFDPRPIDLNAAAGLLVHLMKSDLDSKRVAFTFHECPDSLPLLVDENEVQQLILNLMNNARDAAMAAKKPVLRISTEKVGGWARMKIENNGASISIGLQNKIFTPYFTTKGKGQGTGLGLTICEKIVAKYSGRIFFASDEQGTVFVVDLPRRA